MRTVKGKFCVRESYSVPAEIRDRRCGVSLFGKFEYVVGPARHGHEGWSLSEDLAQARPFDLERAREANALFLRGLLPPPGLGGFSIYLRARRSRAIADSRVKPNG